MLLSVCPTMPPISVPTSSVSVGRPVSLPSAFANADLPVPGIPKQQNAARPDVGRTHAGAQRPPAEGFDRLQSAELFERFTAAMELQQAALLEQAALDLPQRIRQQSTVPHERETKGRFGLIAGQAGGRIEQRIELWIRRAFRSVRSPRRGPILEVARDSAIRARPRGRVFPVPPGSARPATR